MADDGEAATGTGRLRPEKRAAIMAGGQEVFARDGYGQASIGAIAAAAGVSSRTLYKHFEGKNALFAAVVAEAAAEVAAEEVALIERLLSPVRTAREVEPALLAFAIAWLTGDVPSATRRALFRQVRGEADHLGTDVVAAWWQAGPGRVMAELTRVLARWSQMGLLDVEDPERAATHLADLVAARPGPPGSPVPEGWREEWIAAGVGVFARGYRP